jgi:hypothetical protein
MTNVAAGTGISVSHTPGEGSTASVSLNATLDDLSNVNAPSPANGDVLQYNTSSSSWVSASIQTGGGSVASLDDIGDVTITSASAGHYLRWNGTAWVNTVLDIPDNSIVNADISTSAGIALSKLATSTAGNIIVYNASGVPTAVAETGDVTIDSSGVSSIASGVIVNADISATAAIELGKLADISTNAQTASYTLVLADKNKIVEMNVASANNLTVPLNSSVAFPVGSQINILQTGAGQTTIVATGGVTINAAPGLKMRAQWSYATLIKRAENTWVLVGDISA